MLFRSVAAVTKATVNPGDMTEADLAGYQAKERDPVCGDYRRWKICGMGPPSSGGMTVYQIMKLMEPFPVAKLKPDSAEAVHLMSEAGRLAYADRNKYVADTDFIALPGQGDGNAAATLDDQVAAVLASVDACTGPPLVVGHSAAASLAWVAALLVVALALPNSMQFTSRYEPAIGVKATSLGKEWFDRTFAWKPSLAWAFAVSAIAVTGILTLGGKSEFLYWQF